MKVSELTGAALEYWVAKAEGLPLSVEANQGDYILIGTGRGDMAKFSPSADWSQGGPIIERDNIRLQPPRHAPQWTADCVGEGGVVHFADGPTPLIAAMRAKVASKYGGEVPDLMGERMVVG